jgi:heme/copper-type cytochrome/quinol oxidase subunit 1
MPRRYSAYPAEVAQGVTYAQVSLAFVTLLFAGIVLYLWDTVHKCWKGLSA